MKKKRKLKQQQKIKEISVKEVKKIKRNFKKSPAKLKPKSRRENK